MQFDVSSYCDALVGWPRDWLHDRGLTDETIRKYLLGYSLQRNAIVIPYLNALLDVRRLRYRNFEGEPKYIWDSEGERGVHLFNVRATRKPKIWITEGEFDAMLLGQLGFPSCAVPGAKLFKYEWRFLFSYCDQLTVVFDHDEAGIEGAQRVSGILGPVVGQFRNVRLPEGMDVTDMYLHDRDKLVELVN